jgi:hypothetical protein
VVSVSLITLGALLAPYVLVGPAAIALWSYDPKAFADFPVFAAIALVEGLLGVAMVWGGFRLRRRPESAKELAG